MTDTRLDIRTGLPEDLRYLFEEIPRPDWHGHPNFGEMTSFYLDRHAMFREIQTVTGAETRAFLDGEREGPAYARNFGRLAQFFLQQLHTHHSIEDAHYFPALLRLEPKLQRGFDILDADHKAIDGRLHAYADDANAMLKALQAGEAEAEAAAMAKRIDALGALLDRHLEDEEELVVPIMLSKGERALHL